MRIAVDLDGTLDCAPYEFLEILQALRSCGNRVTILTGATDTPVTQETFDQKSYYLNQLGLGEAFDDLVVIGADGDDLSQKKADWCAANHVSVMIDNDQGNAIAASGVVNLVLVPWPSRKP